MVVYVAIEVVTGTLLHTKPVCTVSLESQFLLRFGISYCRAESRKFWPPGIWTDTELSENIS